MYKIFTETDEHKSMMNTIAYWNNSDKVYRLMVPCDVVGSYPNLWQEEDNIRYYLYSCYPMYANGNIEQRNGYFYVQLFEKQTLTERSFKRMFNFEDTATYTVVGHQILTKNLDGCAACEY